MEEAHKIVANYMKASTALETYLHKDGVLTPLEEQSIHTTLETTRTLFDGWRRRTRNWNRPFWLHEPCRRGSQRILLTWFALMQLQIPSPHPYARVRRRPFHPVVPLTVIIFDSPWKPLHLQEFGSRVTLCQS